MSLKIELWRCPRGFHSRLISSLGTLYQQRGHLGGAFELTCMKRDLIVICEVGELSALGPDNLVTFRFSQVDDELFSFAEAVIHRRAIRKEGYLGCGMVT